MHIIHPIEREIAAALARILPKHPAHPGGWTYQRDVADAPAAVEPEHRPGVTGWRVRAPR